MAYAFVKKTENSANSNATTITATGGNTLIWVARTSAGAGNPVVTGVTDSGSETWTQAIATFNGAAGSGTDWYTVFYMPNIASGLTSVTGTFTGGPPGSCNIVVIEYSGLATTTPFIVGAHNQQAAPGTTANAITSGTATNVTTVPALILGVVGNNGNGDTVAGTGYTIRGTVTGNYAIEDARATSSGNQQVTFTAATHGGTDDYTTFLLAFAEAGGGGGDVFLGQAFM